MRIRATKAKKKFWNHGDSCVTNPKVKKFRHENLWENIPIIQKNNSSISLMENTTSQLYSTEEKNKSLQIRDHIAEDLNIQFKDAEIYKRINMILDNLKTNFIQGSICDNPSKALDLLLQVLSPPEFDENNQIALLFLIDYIFRRITECDRKNYIPILFEKLKNILADAKYKNPLLYEYALKLACDVLLVIDSSSISRERITKFYIQIFQYLSHPKTDIAKNAYKIITNFLSLNGKKYTFNQDVKIFNLVLSEAHEAHSNMKYILKLLTIFFKRSTPQEFSKLCDRVFHIFLDASTSTRCLIFDSFTSIFENNLPFDPILFLKIYPILLELKPGSNDDEMMIRSWIKMINSACDHHPGSGDETVPCPSYDVALLLFDYFHSRIPGIHQFVSDSLKRTIEAIHCQTLKWNKRQSIFTLIFQKTIDCFSLFPVVVYPHICATLESVLTTLEVTNTLNENVVLKICTFFDQKTNASLKPHFSSLMQSYIEKNGTDLVFDVLKSTFDENLTQFEHAWLLDVLKKCAFINGFSLVQNKLIPLSNIVKAKKNNSKLNYTGDYHNLCDDVYLKVWSLFPSLMRQAKDFNQFAFISKQLLELVNSDNSISSFILDGIKFLSINHTFFEESTQHIDQTISAWFPVLFDKHVQHMTPDALSGLVYTTIVSLYTITETSVIENYYEQLLVRISTSVGTSTQYYQELIDGIIPFLSSEKLIQIYNDSIKSLDTLEEKSLKLRLQNILTILHTKNSEFQRYFNDNYANISQYYPSLFDANLITLAPVLLAILNKIISQMYKHTFDANYETIIKYTVLCLDKPTLKIRRKAAPLISSIYIKISENDHIIYPFISKILLEHCTKYQLGYLEFFCILITQISKCDRIPLPMDIIDIWLKLFDDCTPQKYNLLLKLFQHIRKEDTFSIYYSRLISGLFMRSSLLKIKCNRIKVEKMIKRMVELFGYDKVKGFVPADDGRLFHSLYKNAIKSRKISAKSLVHKGENDDADTYYEIEEEDPEEIIDISNFNNLKIGKNINKSNNDDFPTTRDGKIIVKVSDSDESSDEEKDIEINNTKITETDEVTLSAPIAAKNFNKNLMNTNSKLTGITKTVEFGNEYKAPKAGGDRKIKGKPDPYSYVPLSAKRSGKKYINQLSGQFKGVVKAKKSLKRFSNR